jgi:hypothetical protein
MFAHWLADFGGSERAKNGLERLVFPRPSDSNSHTGGPTVRMKLPESVWQAGSQSVAISIP